jgi:hypothetical protein
MSERLESADDGWMKLVHQGDTIRTGLTAARFELMLVAVR